MEEYDIITDSYSAEVISLMLLERAWSKYRGYMEAKDIKKDEKALQDRLAKMDKEIGINTALDKQRNHAKR